MVIVHVLYPVLQFGALLRLVDGVGEEVDVGVQRELVHRVDLTQVRQYEEQDGGAPGTRPVRLPDTRTPVRKKGLLTLQHHVA